MDLKLSSQQWDLFHKIKLKGVNNPLLYSKYVMENLLSILSIIFVGLFFIFALMSGLVFCEMENAYGERKTELIKFLNTLLNISVISGLIGMIIFGILMQYYI